MPIYLFMHLPFQIIENCPGKDGGTDPEHAFVEDKFGMVVRVDKAFFRVGGTQKEVCARHLFEEIGHIIVAQGRLFYFHDVFLSHDFGGGLRKFLCKFFVVDDGGEILDEFNFCSAPACGGNASAGFNNAPLDEKFILFAGRSAVAVKNNGIAEGI